MSKIGTVKKKNYLDIIFITYNVLYYVRILCTHQVNQKFYLAPQMISQIYHNFMLGKVFKILKTNTCNNAKLHLKHNN